MSEENAEQSSSDLKLPKKKWVKFEDDMKAEVTDMSKPAVLEPESLQVNDQSSQKSGSSYIGAILPTESVHISSYHMRIGESSNSSVNQGVNLRTVNLHETDNGVSSVLSTNAIRQGFANGDIIVSLLPVNSSLPWITPAKFRPELVPEELMAQGLTLTVEDYVQIMETLTNDLRFTLYNVCYKRILILWILTALVVLMVLLISGVQGLTLFSLGVMWLILNCAAIFLCMWIKIKLNQNLERCIAQINRHLIHHKIILGLDDRGHISCHKVNLCFIYFDTTDCIKKLKEIIENEESAGRVVSRELSHENQNVSCQFQERMDIDAQDIIIQGTQTTRVSRKQERGEQLFARYIQRWSKDYLRHRLDWTMNENGGNPVDTRHLAPALCPCQYIEEYLKCKPGIDKRAYCPSFSSYLRERGID